MDLLELKDKVVKHLDDILTKLDIDYKKYSNYYSFTCPIHGSDNEESCSVYDSGIWRCWTKHCEEEAGQDIFAFIGAVLEKNKSAGVVWCLKYFGIKDLQPGENALRSKDNGKFIAATDILNKERDIKIGGIPRNLVRQSLEIPSQFFIGRGYSSEILDRYDVGYCNNPNKAMNNRVVVPIYEDTGFYMIGCSARSVFPICHKCKCYHSISEKCPEDKKLYSKWRHSSGFYSANHLYNYWFARTHILKTGLAILVEGAPDVWRLEEANINFGLGTFGCNLSVQQRNLLLECGTKNIIIATDNDDAGKKFRSSLIQSLSRLYNVYEVQTNKKDIGETSINEVNRIFSPLLEKLL